MPNTTISVDEYLNERKMSANEDGKVFKAASAPRSYDPEKRSCHFIMSSQEIDRDMDIVVTRGIDLANFEANPIALMNHNPNMVLGSWDGVSKKPKRLEGTVSLADEGTAPYVDMMAAMLGQGIVRAASIGFMPRTLKRREMENGEYVRGFIIEESELYECSIVSIPANAQALAKMASDGNVLAKDLIEHTLDTWCKNAEGLIVPRADFEIAHAETTGNKTAVQTMKIELDSKGIKEAVDKAFEEALAKVPAVDVSGQALSEAKALEADEEDKLDASQENQEEAVVVDNGFLKALKSLLGINEPAPPVKADPERVKAALARAQSIQVAHEDA